MKTAFGQVLNILPGSAVKENRPAPRRPNTHNKNGCGQERQSLSSKAEGQHGIVMDKSKHVVFHDDMTIHDRKRLRGI